MRAYPAITVRPAFFTSCQLPPIQHSSATLPISTAWIPDAATGPIACMPRNTRQVCWNLFARLFHQLRAFPLKRGRSPPAPALTVSGRLFSVYLQVTAMTLASKPLRPLYDQEASAVSVAPIHCCSDCYRVVERHTVTRGGRLPPLWTRPSRRIPDNPALTRRKQLLFQQSFSFFAANRTIY